MATSTYKSFLMIKKKSEPESGTYEKLVDIKDYPDLGGAPETLETTTLSDGMQTYIDGIQSQDALEFTANYDLEKYKEITAMKGAENDFSVWLGGREESGVAVPTGTEGKFNFKGYISIRVVGKGVNEVREMTVSIAPSTPIALGE